MNLRLDKRYFRKDNLDYNAFEGYTKKIGKKILFKGGFGNAEINRMKRKEDIFEIFNRKFEFNTIVKRYHVLMKKNIHYEKTHLQPLARNRRSTIYITIDPSITHYKLQNTISTTNEDTFQCSNRINNRLTKNKSQHNAYYHPKPPEKFVDYFIEPPKMNFLSHREQMIEKMKSQFNFYQSKRTFSEAEKENKIKKMFISDVMVDNTKIKTSKIAIKIMKRKDEEYNKIKNLGNCN